MGSDAAGTDVELLGGSAGAVSASGAGRRSSIWRLADRAIPLDRPRVMGILNLTPDSFWGGGRSRSPGDALRRAERMIEEGADILDVGGESTRPGAVPVSAHEERARTLPVIDVLVREHPDVPVSIDTVKAEVARAALDAGAAIVNDVSALRLDPAMAVTCAEARAGVVLMHSRGGVADMARYHLAEYGPDPTDDVALELRAAVRHAVGAGIAGEAIVLDPGLGFAKRTEHTVAVLRGLPRLATLGFPLLVGPSRKRFVGELAGGLPVEERVPGTVAACVVAWIGGARIFRVHDVAPVRRALAVAEAVTP